MIVIIAIIVIVLLFILILNTTTADISDLSGHGVYQWNEEGGAEWEKIEEKKENIIEDEINKPSN